MSILVIFRKPEFGVIQCYQTGKDKNWWKMSKWKWNIWVDKSSLKMPKCDIFCEFKPLWRRWCGSKKCELCACETLLLLNGWFLINGSVQPGQPTRKNENERCDDVKKYLPTHKSNTAYCHITLDFSYHFLCSFFSGKLSKDRIENGESINRKRFRKGEKTGKLLVKMVRCLK